MVFKGNQADPRMRQASTGRGIEITSISRPIRPSDFRDFDLILAMDKQNKGHHLYPKTYVKDLTLFSFMWVISIFLRIYIFHIGSDYLVVVWFWM